MASFFPSRKFLYSATALSHLNQLITQRTFFPEFFNNCYKKSFGVFLNCQQRQIRDFLRKSKRFISCSATNLTLIAEALR